MTEQYPEAGVDIVVFSNTEQTEITTQALVDASLPASLISKSLVDRLQVRYEKGQHDPVRDQQKMVHTPLGEVELHLHRSDVPKSQPENFLVVETIASIVLRTAAVPRRKEPNVLTLGLEPQTEDQKRRQELKKRDVESRRASEKKDQAEREKQKRSVEQ